MKRFDSNGSPVTDESRRRAHEFMEELRAELEKNPDLLDEFLEGLKELNRTLARTVAGLEESNRRSEHTRREIDALKAEIHAQAR
ncbi:MAG TPA: hypothetical protein VF092_12480 [Longimicrobium sp.]